ncbi:MAG: hypothetical protein ABW128_16865 [Rhizorhabdus sp.]
MVEHIRNNLTAREIAAREGLEMDYACRERARILKKEGITPNKRPRLSPAEREKVLPYGLGRGTQALRGRLGTVIDDRNRRFPDETPIDLAGKIGLTETCQRLSHTNSSGVDWTLSQIERLANLEGKDFVSFMKELLRL